MELPGGLWYMVEGINPQPWEASQAQVVGRGKVHMHRTPQLEFYQRAVAESFTLQNPNFVPLMTGVPLQVAFYFWREIEIVEKIGGKGGTSRSNVADTTNLQKALEDALQNVLYGNDQLNTCIHSRIVAQDVGVTPRIMIHIAPDPGIPPDELALLDAVYHDLHKVQSPKSNILPGSGDDLF